jgi:putative nucleotidyltransferase with HDIG domain
MKPETIEELAGALERKDRYTGGHARRVACLAERLARRLGLDETLALRVRLAALLHDVGKIGIDDAILKKPAALTDAERAIMRRHPELAPGLLEGSAAFDEVEFGARHHHERWDGSGYPDRLAAEAIPLVARIIAVADAYDAMVVSRPYRPAVPRAEALAELRASSGSQFDPRVVEAFVASMGPSC